MKLINSPTIDELGITPSDWKAFSKVVADPFNEYRGVRKVRDRRSKALRKIVVRYTEWTAKI